MKNPNQENHISKSLSILWWLQPWLNNFGCLFKAPKVLTGAPLLLLAEEGASSTGSFQTSEAADILTAFCAKFVLLYLQLKKTKLVLGIQISCWSYVQFGSKHPMRIIYLKAAPVSLHSFKGILHVPLRSSVSKLHFLYIHFHLYLKQNRNWRASLFWYKQEAAGLCMEITSTPRRQLLQALNSTLIN